MHCRRRASSLAMIVLSACCWSAPPAGAAEPAAISREAEEFFESKIRPILADKCIDCHGPKEQWSSLRLDSREAILEGGENGPAAISDKPDQSELLRRITSKDDDVRMPPPDADQRLTGDEIAALRHWVEQGLPWPATAALVKPSDRAAEDHWAFQPVQQHEPPAVKNETWPASPIDRFILQKLDSAGLGPSPAADRRTLIRRATYDLTGLPPTLEEVQAFESDISPDAYVRLVDRLLASPHYGEQWGRHWLDVARYSDTKGYVYAREERFFVHAPAYRDWVIQAFNSDLRYDRFLLLQIAADQAAPEDPAALAAMGFLTLGRRFLGVTPNIIDDRIDVVTRGTMGLTVACARCHDHKYDPIRTADYYSLYGVFQNCVEQLAPIPRPANVPPPSPEFEKELQARKQKLQDTLTARRDETALRIRTRVLDYLLAQRELDKYPEQGFDIIIAKDDLIPEIVRRWNAYLVRAAKQGDPVFLPWAAFVELREEEFASRAAEVTDTLKSSSAKIHPRVAEAFAQPPATFREVAERYAAIFQEIDRQWKESCEAAKRDSTPAPQALSNAEDEQLRQVLYGPRSPCVVPDEPIVNIESMLDSDSVNALWALQNEVDRWLLQPPMPAPHAVILKDREHLVEQRIFLRGNPAKKGDYVPRQFVDVVAGPDRQPFSQGSGRLELARAIIDPSNPLTARVWVNRVWMHHFGAPLVRTPSDFGLRAEPPSHPELLDYLATQFIASGWSTKALHRVIMLSAVYQQRSDGPQDAAIRQRAQQLDPENRLLWRMNSRRLSFEELRDTLLATSAELNREMGGKAVDLFPGAGAPLRRSVYGLVDRQFLLSVLRVFDFPNPDLHIPQRSETAVPQQALFALNDPFIAARAKALVKRIEEQGSAAPNERVARIFQILFQREPTPPQLTAALQFIESAEKAKQEDTTGPPATAAAWSYGYGELDQATGRMKTLQPLPYFSGSAWQGGPQWPDAKLGWLQITALGGHPGNDLQHASVRRWTAPRDGVVSVKSTVTHEVAAGDGIRCWIVSSRHGIVKSVTVHNTKQPLDVETIEVRAGDSLDFVVDFNANLNSEQHFWSPEVRLTAPADGTTADPLAWNAEADFFGPVSDQLSPWEQLAQVLLVSNELMFVD